MFFSLDQPVTSDQISVSHLLSSNLKREETAWPLLFSKCDDTKKQRLTFGVQYLVFNH